MLERAVACWRGPEAGLAARRGFALAIEISEREPVRAERELGHLRGVSSTARLERIERAAQRQVESVLEKRTA